jgi:hypothetical protein
MSSKRARFRSASRRTCSAFLRSDSDRGFLSRDASLLTNGVGCRTGEFTGTGVATTEGEGLAATTGVITTDGDGLAETAGDGDGVATTGFWLPTITPEAEPFAEATWVCPPCFERAFCSTFTAAMPSAPIATSATRMPPNIILSEPFRGGWSCSLTKGLTFRWSLDGLRRCLFIQNEGRRMTLQDVPCKVFATIYSVAACIATQQTRTQ